MDCDITTADTGFDLAVKIPNNGDINIVPGQINEIEISTHGISPTNGL